MSVRVLLGQIQVGSCPLKDNCRTVVPRHLQFYFPQFYWTTAKNHYVKNPQNTGSQPWVTMRLELNNPFMGVA